MTATTIAGREIQIDSAGYLTDPSQWDEDLGRALAALAGVELTDEHWAMVRWMRTDFAQRGETATSYTINVAGVCATRRQFELWGKKPMKKASYVAGLPVPAGCV